MAYKLSIIVPTYNGAGWIKDTLESVLSQLDDYKEDVEFIVRDNASTDKTEEIVRGLNDEYGGLIRYDRRNSTAIADVNFREAINLSSGDYVLLLGDDDLLFPNYIYNTLKLLDENPNVGLIYYNRVSTSREYEGALLKHNNPCKSFIRKYNEMEDFINEHPSGPDFMSVNVVRRECLLKGFPFAKEKYYGVEWYSVILYGLQNFESISVFYPMILQRAPKVRFWDDRALLYVVIGVDNLFRDISQLYPTAYESWLCYSKEKVSKINYIIMSIPLNRALYKNKWLELSSKLNFNEKSVAYLLIHMPFMTFAVVRIVKVLLFFKKIVDRLFVKFKSVGRV